MIGIDRQDHDPAGPRQVPQADDDLVVEASEAGRRLDEFLAGRCTGFTRTWIRKRIAEGHACLNAVPAPSGVRLRVGDRVRLTFPEEDLASGMTPEPGDLEILFEDEHLVVLVKPAGMLMHPTGPHRGGTLLNFLVHHLGREGRPPGRPGLPHRLDRATSGLVVVSRTQQALRDLTMQFQKRQVAKRYTALTWGHPRLPAGEWRSPIGNRDWGPTRWCISSEGRDALTRYRVGAKLGRFALVDLEPVTGRTNQLRLHAAWHGCPIAGDDLFGPPHLCGTPLPGPGRLFLHASRLGFRHPVSGLAMEYESSLPGELQEYLDGLGVCSSG